MNRIILPVLAVGALAGLGGYALSDRAGAQGVPPAQVSTDAQSSGAAADRGQNRQGGWGQRRWLMSQERLRDRRTARARDWGLFALQADKQLSAADVQTIAQAILLRHGNHTWKVANVAQNQDDTVSFAFATPSGEVIARFAVDTHTGRIRRLG